MNLAASVPARAESRPLSGRLKAAHQPGAHLRSCSCCSGDQLAAVAMRVGTTGTGAGSSAPLGSLSPKGPLPWRSLIALHEQLVSVALQSCKQHRAGVSWSAKQTAVAQPECIYRKKQIIGSSCQGLIHRLRNMSVSSSSPCAQSLTCLPGQTSGLPECLGGLVLGVQAKQLTWAGFGPTAECAGACWAGHAPRRGAPSCRRCTSGSASAGARAVCCQLCCAPCMHSILSAAASAEVSVHTKEAKDYVLSPGTPLQSRELPGLARDSSKGAFAPTGRVPRGRTDILSRAAQRLCALPSWLCRLSLGRLHTLAPATKMQRVNAPKGGVLRGRRDLHGRAVQRLRVLPCWLGRLQVARGPACRRVSAGLRPLILVVRLAQCAGGLCSSICPGTRRHVGWPCNTCHGSHSSSAGVLASRNCPCWLPS